LAVVVTASMSVTQKNGHPKMPVFFPIDRTLAGAVY